MQPLAAMTWEDARAAAALAIAVLPVGAIEAHGPHLPLETDVIIAQAMARAGAERLAARGLHPVILPPLTYTAAGFAGGFAGTLSLRPETVTATVVEIAAGLSAHGFGLLAIANAHLDPAHLSSLAAAVQRARDELEFTIVFPDLTTKPWALRLGEEFRSGACHAGRFETSLVLAERPDLVPRARREDYGPAGGGEGARGGGADAPARAGHHRDAAFPEAHHGRPASTERSACTACSRTPPRASIRARPSSAVASAGQPK